MRRKAAGPVPFDIDGDGVYDLIVVPARTSRSDVTREREAADGGEEGRR